MEDNNKSFCEVAGSEPDKNRENKGKNSNQKSEHPRQRQFNCNICFECAADPVVTRCGHLYCWPCLHAWLDRGALECPVCKSGVRNSDIIPIYGQGDENIDPRTKTHEYNLPKRPAGTRHPTDRPEGLSSGWRNLSNFTFGIFPLGIGFTFSNVGRANNSDGSRRLTREEQINQGLSLLFLFSGILLTLWILLMGGQGGDF